MINITIDNNVYNIKENYTIFQYCAKIGINLPCFCYHERLSIVGNCRVCIVEVNKGLVIGCATLITEGMKINTNTKRIKKVRESIMEFLLINHPLDCPICDQAGECDLQDISKIFGVKQSRYYNILKKQ